MEPAVRRARPDEAAAVVDMLVTAFAAEAAMRYFFGDGYQRYAPHFFGYLLDLRLRGGEVWVALTDDVVAAAAMFNPPGGLTLPAAEINRSWESMAEQFPADVRGRLEEYHDRLAGHEPTSRHYYLSVIATHAAYRGRGLTRSLLAPALSRADERGWDTYLETASAENVTIYQRLGFEVEAEIDLPDGPTVRWMRRPTHRE